MPPVFEYIGDDTRTYAYEPTPFVAEPGMDPVDSATNPDEVRFVEQASKAPPVFTPPPAPPAPPVVAE